MACATSLSVLGGQEAVQNVEGPGPACSLRAADAAEPGNAQPRAPHSGRSQTRAEFTEEVTAPVQYGTRIGLVGEWWD